MEYGDYLSRFYTALHDEITAVRDGGGQKTFLSDGHYLGKKNDYHVYSFTADAEIHLPDDTPCELEYQGIKHLGILISVAGFDLVLELAEHLVNLIQTAVLYTSPWYLLEELQKRLYKIKNAPEHEAWISRRLLSGKEEGQESDIKQAQVLLDQIKQRGHPVSYNEYQREAVGHVLANEVSFIWGPPGTGKTTTLGMVAAALIERGESVLIVAHSNVAVDVAIVGAIKKLVHHPLYPTGKFLRYGVTYLEEVNQYSSVHIRGILRQQNPDLIKSIELLESYCKSRQK